MECLYETNHMIPDWKKIALKAVEELKWCSANLKPLSGSGLVMNTQTGSVRSWKRKLQEIIDLIPEALEVK